MLAVGSQCKKCQRVRLRGVLVRARRRRAHVLPRDGGEPPRPVCSRVPFFSSLYFIRPHEPRDAILPRERGQAPAPFQPMIPRNSTLVRARGHAVPPRTVWMQLCAGGDLAVRLARARPSPARAANEGSLLGRALLGQCCCFSSRPAHCVLGWSVTSARAAAAASAACRGGSHRGMR